MDSIHFFIPSLSVTSFIYLYVLRTKCVGAMYRFVTRTRMEIIFIFYVRSLQLCESIGLDVLLESLKSATFFLLN